MADDKLTPEEQKQQIKVTQANDLRRALADVYTFVRSREVNKTIASFTFDHYIYEEMQRLKGEGQKLRDASGSDEQAVGTRPTELQYITSIEDEFTKNWEKLSDLAEKGEEGLSNTTGTEEV